jgi:hypothetical protein
MDFVWNVLPWSRAAMTMTDRELARVRVDEAISRMRQAWQEYQRAVEEWNAACTAQLVSDAEQDKDRR